MNNRFWCHNWFESEHARELREQMLESAARIAPRSSWPSEDMSQDLSECERRHNGLRMLMDEDGEFWIRLPLSG